MILDFEVMRRDVKREGNVNRGDEEGSNWMIHAVGHLWSWAISGQSLPKFGVCFAGRRKSARDQCF